MLKKYRLEMEFFSAPAVRLFRENHLIKERYEKVKEDERIEIFLTELLSLVKKVATEKNISVTPEMEQKIHEQVDEHLQMVLYASAVVKYGNNYNELYTLPYILKGLINVRNFKRFLKCYADEAGAMMLLKACK